MGCGSTKTDDTPDAYDRHQPLSRDRQYTSRRRYADDVDEDDFETPVWVPASLERQGRLKTSKSTTLDNFMFRRLAFNRRPFYSQQDFSTVTSISNRSKIRISLSNNGSMIRIETEPVAYNDDEADAEAEETTTSEVAMPAASNKGGKAEDASAVAIGVTTAAVHRSEKPTGRQLAAVKTMNQVVDMAKITLPALARTSTMPSSTPATNSISTPSTLATSYSTSPFATFASTDQKTITKRGAKGDKSSRLSDIPTYDSDNDSLDSLGQRVRRRIMSAHKQQRLQQEQQYMADSPSDTESMDWLCHCNLNHQVKNLPISCSCSDDTIRRMIVNDSVQFSAHLEPQSVEPSAYTKFQSSRPNQSKYPSLTRIKQKTTFESPAQAQKDKHQITSDDCVHTKQLKPTASSFAQSTEYIDSLDECVVPNGDDAIGANGCEDKVNDGVKSDTWSLDDVETGNNALQNHDRNGNMGGSGFKRTVSLGTNLTGLHQMPHSFTVTSLRAPLAVAYSSSSLQSSDDSDHYVELTRIRR